MSMCQSRKLHCITCFCLAIFTFYSFNIFIQNLQLRNFNELIYESHLKLEQNKSSDVNVPVFITVLCQANENYEENQNIANQIDQTVALIKSAAVLSTSVINFIIVVNNDSLFDIVVEEVKSWPIHIQARVNLQKRNASFPVENFRYLFRICATARLFFPEVMTDLDSVVYVDTDTLFLRPPEELWAEFKQFDSDQLSGLVDMDDYYQPSLKFPYYQYGRGGLNSGLWMMNLTRMRSFPGGWMDTCISTYETYKEYIMLHDQDVANIIFHKHPEHLYLLGCRWNYRSFHCQNGVNICEESKLRGISTLHGNALRFLKDDLKMITMFKVWKNFTPGLPLTDLLKSFKDSLDKVDKETGFGSCAYVEGIDNDFTKGLEDYIQDLK